MLRVSGGPRAGQLVPCDDAELLAAKPEWAGYVVDRSEDGRYLRMWFSSYLAKLKQGGLA